MQGLNPQARAPLSMRAKAAMLGAMGSFLGVLGVGACGLCCAGPLVGIALATGVSLVTLGQTVEGIAGVGLVLTAGVGTWIWWRHRKRTCAVPKR